MGSSQAHFKSKSVLVLIVGWVIVTLACTEQVGDTPSLVDTEEDLLVPTAQITTQKIPELSTPQTTTPEETTELDARVLNVELSDEGISPQTLLIPANRRIQLMVRNRGTTEHHFRVKGLAATDVLWLVRGGEAAFATDDTAADEDENAAHHVSSFQPFKPKSLSGVRPFADEVHAYAAPRDMDVMLFVATSVGRYQAECVLHLDETGEVIVSNS